MNKLREGHAMDCFFHANVPSIARCSDCAKPICATCRDDRGACPSCRLAAKIDAATMTRPHLAGNVGPRVSATPAVATPLDPPESRAIVALGYPLFPLALLSLFDRKQSKPLRRHAIQAVAFNLGIMAFAVLLTALAAVPWLGFSAVILLPLLAPLFLIGSCYYGWRAWQGEPVRIPILSDWLDERLPA
ncbi:MAG: DUF4870 domain-containing protein [Vulcanimicrobiaceae bacterium]